MRQKTLTVCFNWIVCGLCYFGVTQYIGTMGTEIFAYVAISAVIQIPGTLLAMWAMEKLGRRTTIITSNLITCASMLLLLAVPDDPQWIKPVLGSVGLFGMSITFPTLFIYSGELYPTVVRSIGMGISSTFARLGAMIAPFVSQLDDFDEIMAPIIFGVSPLVGALLVYRYLPETVGLRLPDTVIEAHRTTKNTWKNKRASMEMMRTLEYMKKTDIMAKPASKKKVRVKKDKIVV